MCTMNNYMGFFLQIYFYFMCIDESLHVCIFVSYVLVLLEARRGSLGIGVISSCKLLYMGAGTPTWPSEREHTLTTPLNGADSRAALSTEYYELCALRGG